MKTVYKVLLGVSAAGLVGFVGYKLMKKKEAQPDPQKEQKEENKEIRLKVNVEKRLPAEPKIIKPKIIDQTEPRPSPIFSPGPEKIFDLPTIPTIPTIPTLFTQLPELPVVNFPMPLPQDNAPSRKPLDYYADERENRFRDDVRRSLYEVAVY
ncbi:MAG: hypothetical protein ACK47E_09360 [Cyclobacteriaceae bacterium]|jgi:hypothetical protein